MYGPRLSLPRMKLLVEGEASPPNCVAHCGGWGLWCKRVSAFLTCFNVGISLVSWYAQVSFKCFSGFLSEISIHVQQCIESTGSVFLHFLPTQILLQCGFPYLFRASWDWISKENILSIISKSSSMYWLCRRYHAKCCRGNRDKPDMANDLKKLSVVGQTFKKKVYHIKVTKTKHWKTCKKQISCLIWENLERFMEEGHIWGEASNKSELQMLLLTESKWLRPSWARRPSVSPSEPQPASQQSNFCSFPEHVTVRRKMSERFTSLHFCGHVSPETSEMSNVSIQPRHLEQAVQFDFLW